MNRHRIGDRLSVMLLTWALCSLGFVLAREQIENQDRYNGRIEAMVDANRNRLDAQDRPDR